MKYSRENAYFEEIEHTADTGIKSYASSLPQLFSNMAYGMFSLIFGTLSPKAEKKYKLSLSATSYEGLLIEWLTEINFLLTVRHFIIAAYTDIEITRENSSCKISAVLWGEETNRYDTRIRTEIKAVTWHQLTIKKKARGFSTQVIFDI